jgi:hypothetical protein
VARSLKLRLAPFEREALDAYGASQRVPPDRIVHTAVFYYLRQENSNRHTWPMPALRGETAKPEVQLEVELSEDASRALAEQAAAQGVDPEPLARHALLFFLADIDSGEAAKTLDSALRDE